VDIGDVHLEDRATEDLHRVVHRNRREGVARRIDDQGVGVGARRLDQVDQHAFVVGLVERQLGAREPGERLATRLDRVERGGPVDMRLPHAEQVQVGAVEDHDAHGGPSQRSKLM
jgi:hypothetical protein